MTPQEFLCIQKRQQSIINEAEWIIAAARVQAEKCKAPKHLRPVKHSDLKPGAIIWHKRSRKDGGYYWNIVGERDRYSRFDSYMADDGCSYHIKNAFIEE